jgi:hypothetical protein
MSHLYFCQPIGAWRSFVAVVAIATSKAIKLRLTPRKIFSR